MRTRLECGFPSCPKTFSSVFNRQRHYNVRHLGLKPFQCADCFKYFATKQNLDAHSFVHSQSPQPEQPVGEVLHGEVAVPLLTDMVRDCEDLDLVPMLHLERIYLSPLRASPVLPPLGPALQDQKLPSFPQSQSQESN